MGLVRIKPKTGVISKSCPICFRHSPIDMMTKVSHQNKEVLVCRTIGGFKGSCEAKFYEPDKKELINQYKNFSW